MQSIPFKRIRKKVFFGEMTHISPTLRELSLPDEGEADVLLPLLAQPTKRGNLCSLICTLVFARLVTARSVAYRKR